MVIARQTRSEVCKHAWNSAQRPTASPRALLGKVHAHLCLTVEVDGHEVERWPGGNHREAPLTWPWVSPTLYVNFSAQTFGFFDSFMSPWVTGHVQVICIFAVVCRWAHQTWMCQILFFNYVGAKACTFTNKIVCSIEPENIDVQPTAKRVTRSQVVEANVSTAVVIFPLAFTLQKILPVSPALVLQTD